jgi:hypothetical protein
MEVNFVLQSLHPVDKHVLLEDRRLSGLYRTANPDNVEVSPYPLGISQQQG